MGAAAPNAVVPPLLSAANPEVSGRRTRSLRRVAAQVPDGFGPFQKTAAPHDVIDARGNHFDTLEAVAWGDALA